jgi:hypothetical protein
MRKNHIRVKIFRSGLIKIDIMMPENKALKLANNNSTTINKRGYIASYSSGHCGTHVTIV